MASISNLVSTFRGKYKLFSDDTKWTDRFIISAMNMARTKLAYQWSQKQKKLSQQWYYGFCMPLCVGKPLKCPCIAEAQCHALVSRFELPKTAGLAKGITPMFVRTGSGLELSMISPDEANYMNLNPAYTNKPGYWVENYRGNRYLVVWNVLDLDVIYISLVPEDLDSLAEIPLCDGTGNIINDCIDWKTEEYPIEANLIYDLFKMTEELLIPQRETNDDFLNDAVDLITK